ncbi:MAG TPA: D-glycero-beta-D-manno-heptose 1-phosphate adenylyltransferase [Candidatus Omnitrophica bacterium]|nr:D-glycero-beta-D-manno-heptose 1-phosphate adenylyltransferase [Candidatus Omnitrophota bacterium]HBH96874.1 D-glycero-beta-D-manno-heptose 1-phosphate adenylyltransferase [Candidatus Omnitrophota bacterium]HBQ37734.1 D-glycero-beta-D-manno-heptose 1-phosphate adenylyltransferase [Candidatus Omnitrophota bacterium]
MTSPNRFSDNGLRRKLCTLARLASAVRRLQRRGGRVVFTNGCFDLLHPGHVLLLERAKRMGDALVVAVNSDRSVKALKGPARPILPQRARAMLVAALASVDYVTIFDATTPAALIARLQPDVLVKGADWPRGTMVGADVVRRRGGRIVRLPVVNGYSTTRLITRITRRR